MAIKKKIKIVDLDFPEIEEILNQQHEELEFWRRSWRWYIFFGFCAGVLLCVILNAIFG